METCPALFFCSVSEGGDTGLCYLTRSLTDKNNAREPDLWRRAFEPCESALAYGFNTMHTKVAHLKAQTKTTLSSYSPRKQRGSGMERESSMSVWNAHGKETVHEMGATEGNQKKGRCNADESVSKCLSTSCLRLRDSGNSFRQMGS